MFRYVYLSDVSPEFEPYQMGTLAQQARIKNRMLDITSLLLFDGLHFCQYLEGPEAAVHQLMREIGRDARHCTLRTLGEGLSSNPRRLPDDGLLVGYSTDVFLLSSLGKHTGDVDEVVARIWQILPRLDVDRGLESPQ